MHGSRWGHPYTSDWIDHGTLKGKDRDVLPLRVQENCENTERSCTDEHICIQTVQCLHTQNNASHCRFTWSSKVFQYDIHS